jgi:hypothetical protein
MASRRRRAERTGTDSPVRSDSSTYPAGNFRRLRRCDDVDSQPIVVTIDANAAIESNRYADPIKTNGRWVEQMKPSSGSLNGPETMSYEYRGATANGLLVFVAAYSGGGSGTFYYLHILDAASAGALDEDGSTYSRLNLTLVRTCVLGDRWQGDVSISGNSVRIVTGASLDGHGVSPVTIEARRP